MTTVLLGRIMFSFVSDHQIVSQSGCTVLYFYQHWMSFPVLHLHQCLSLLVSDFGSSQICSGLSVSVSVYLSVCLSLSHTTLMEAELEAWNGRRRTEIVSISNWTKKSTLSHSEKETLATNIRSGSKLGRWRRECTH